MLICGADGFIGKTALDYFSDQYQITATIFDKKQPSRGIVPGVEYVSIDLRDENQVVDLFERKTFVK